MNEPGPTTDEVRPTATRMSGRLGSAGRGPGLLAAILVGFVALAIVKPWGLAAIPTPVPDTGARPARPTDSPPPVDPQAALRFHCQEPLGWRVYSRERWSGGTFRSWRSMMPIEAASGPLDSRIPVAPMGRVVEAVGYCSPWRTAERPPESVIVEAWRIEPFDGDGLASVEALALVPFRSFPASPLGALFGAPTSAPAGTGRSPLPGPPGTSSDSEPPAWAAGRYVFALRAGGFERWWAVEIDTAP